MAYLDNAGLYRKYGTEKTSSHAGGEFSTLGALREIELTIDLTDVGSTATILDDTVFFPKSVRVEEVEVVTVTAADSSGDAAVLNLGLVSAADRSTEIDFNGFLAALPQGSIDAAGEKTVLNVGSSYVGAIVGTTTSHTSGAYLCADYDTAAFTAGVIVVRIRYTKV